MKKLDLVGQVYGKLTVLEEMAPHITPHGKKKRMWKCKCECGNETIVEMSNLRNGHTTSCGCEAGRIDYIGKKFGRLTVLKRMPNKKYQCKCDCGNICEVLIANLNNGNTQSCGCLQKEKASQLSFQDLSGEKFGKLTVIKRIKIDKPGVFYLCKCECGGTSIVSANNLKTGTTTSCGCIKSRGEEKLNNLFQKYNISFVSQYSNQHFIYPNGRLPIFDFAIFDKKNNLIMLIEYNGKQHYEYSGYGWDNQENYQKTVNRDILKRQICQDNKMKLIEIPYWNYDNLESIVLQIKEEIEDVE